MTPPSASMSPLPVILVPEHQRTEDMVVLPSHESGLLCLCFCGVNQMSEFRAALYNSNVLGLLYLLGMGLTLKLLEINKLLFFCID